MYKAIIAIGIVAAACLAAGCGSSSDETAEAAVTKAQFIKQAEAACGKAQKEAEDVRRDWEKAHGEEMDFQVGFKRMVGPRLNQEAESLGALTPPEGDEAEVARMIDNLSKAADLLTAQGTELKSTSSIDAFKREMKAYGLETCGL